MLPPTRAHLATTATATGWRPQGPSPKNSGLAAAPVPQCCSALASRPHEAARSEAAPIVVAPVAVAPPPCFLSQKCSKRASFSPAKPHQRGFCPGDCPSRAAACCTCSTGTFPRTPSRVRDNLDPGNTLPSNARHLASRPHTRPCQRCQSTDRSAQSTGKRPAAGCAWPGYCATCRPRQLPCSRDSAWDVLLQRGQVARSPV
mmetsp:Transcript_83959/g.195298  ORF Transcript_83959/g.195298 Transcript_83959/m.195298 type:complete len:202 (-) Transcript_83959:562-1167(-)